MSYQREHKLQAAIYVFAKRVVTVPMQFMGFDRSRKQSDLQHIMEAQRAIKAGTPDTCLLWDGRSLWVEIKTRGNKPTERQVEVGRDIQATRNLWDWCDSVAGYCALLRKYGVPLIPAAEIAAMDADAKLAAREMRHAAKTPSKPRTRKARPSVGQIRKVEALRARYGF